MEKERGSTCQKAFAGHGAKAGLGILVVREKGKK